MYEKFWKTKRNNGSPDPIVSTTCYEIGFYLETTGNNKNLPVNFSVNFIFHFQQ